MDESNMSDLIVQYNELADKLGKDRVTSFKHLNAARAGILKLQTLMGKTMPEETMVQEPQTSDATAAAEALGEGATPIQPTAPPVNGSPMNSVGRRGPTQGVGDFCKTLIKEGKSNVEILAAVQDKFQGTAKTSSSCIAFYRNALKGGAASRPRPGKAGADIANLEAKAEKLQKQIQDAKDAQALREAEEAQKLIAQQQAAQAQAQPSA